jgi:protein SCO1/2
MIWLLLLACWGDNAYILEGTVVEVHPGEVVVAHEKVERLGMDAMTMPFPADQSQLDGLQPGDRIYARLMMEQDGPHLDRIRVTGHGEAPKLAVDPAGPVHAGEIVPATPVTLPDGTTTTVGAGQSRRTALTFLYTRCPFPEFCPAVTARLQALQGMVGPDTRILAITLDPDGDTPAVLQKYASDVGADPAIWQFGRLEKSQLDSLALKAGLSVTVEDGNILHAIRLLVIDKDGRLIERYDDTRWSNERVAEQLKTGGPPAPPGSDGTMSP